MEIPGLGVIQLDEQFGWYRSKRIRVPVLGNKLCQIVVEGYDEDRKKSEFHTAIANFLSASPSVLEEAAPYVFQYYEASKEQAGPDEEFVKIKSAASVFRHVQTKDAGKILAAQDLRLGRALPGQREPLTGFRDQFFLVHAMQSEEEFGLPVEPGANAFQPHAGC